MVLPTAKFKYATKLASSWSTSCGQQGRAVIAELDGKQASVAIAISGYRANIELSCYHAIK
jgi:hypothetical protein